MRFNPNAVVLWGIGACAGYLIGGDLRSAIIGLTVALSLSLLASLGGR